MKKIVLGIASFCIAGLACSFNLLSGGGEIGATGSPGEGSCNSCHGGGPAGTTVSITASPAFTNNFYEASTNYTITITVAHPTLPRFGFDAEILTSGNVNAGVMSVPGSGVQLFNFGSKKNATHTTPKAGSGSASFTFHWLSPVSGNATIYVSGNAVNFDGNTSGDAPIATSMLLTLDPTTGISANAINQVSQVTLFPNPASDMTTISYCTLSPQKITVDLTDISGKVIKTFLNENCEPGPHSNILDLKGIAKGVYFVKTSAGGEKVSQKLISVQ